LKIAILAVRPSLYSGGMPSNINVKTVVYIA